jgi:DNA-binding transcriptional LysR family regulator
VSTQLSGQPWELDTRHLSAFRAIAATRSISRAATELGYGQSAVSQQLAALEKVVGRRLFDRGTGPRPVTLTPAGEALLPHAEWVLDHLDSARAELDRLDVGGSGSIRVGTFQSAGARLLPEVLAQYRQQWPNIAVTIHNETHDDDLETLVRNGSVDVAFSEGTFSVAGLERRELMHDRYIALVPPNHRLAASTSISLSELRGEDLIGGYVDDQCSTRSERAMQLAGIEQHIVFRTDDNATRQRLVHAGLGCAVVPGLTYEPGLENGAVAVPLTEDLHRVICLLWATDRTPSFALTRFIELAPSIVSDRINVRTSAPKKRVKRS